MKFLDKIHPKDWKYVGVEPDPDFNPEHNEYVIEKTIRDSEKMARKRRREFQENLAERTEALATYLQSLEQGGKESDVTKYFGKKYKSYLAGKYALQRIKDGLTSVGVNGRIIRRPGEIID